MRRTEDDLRAAFAARADDAPSARSVLAEVKATQLAPRRRWLVPVGAAAAAVVAAAIAVPLALHSGGGTYHSDSGAAAGAARPQLAAPAAPGPCRLDQVTLTLRWTPGGGTLTATNTSSAGCRLTTRTVLRAFGATGAQVGTDTPLPVGPGPRPTTLPPIPSTLRPGTVATAPVSWAGCPDAAVVTIRAVWPDGLVDVAQQGRPPACTHPSGSAYLRVGAFTGLS